MRTALSFAMLQAGWFACVLGAVHGAPWLGPLVVLGALSLHVTAQPARAREVAILFATAALGFAIDTVLLRTGTTAIAGASVAPPWLVALWPNFAAATARGGSLAGLSRRARLAALVGALGGAFAYWSGEEMGAITLGVPHARALVSIARVWALFVPTLFALRSRLDSPARSDA